MTERRFAVLLFALVAACQTYAPAPVDVEAHAREFAARVPDPVAVAAFAARLHRAGDAKFDPSDGCGLDEARLLTLFLDPELHQARLRAGVAAAGAAHAGLWPDPALNGDFARILESVAHPWIAGGALALTLPITGRLGLEKDLADSAHAQALLEARLAEAHALDGLDARWVRWSAARVRVDLLRELGIELTALEAIATRLAAAELITKVAARTFTLERVTREVELLRVEAEVAAAEIEVRRAMGLPPAATLRLVPTLVADARAPAADVRAARVLAGPRVAVRQREHAVAERALALAIRKQWPELTLLPGFSEEDAQPRVTLGFTLPLPLWNANAREIEQARAQRDLAAQVVRTEVEHVLQDLARAEVAAQAAAAQRALVDAQLVPLAAQQIADARRLAELGQLDAILVLDSHLRGHQAKTAAVDAALAEAEATVQINSLFWPTLSVGDAGEVSR